MKKATVVLIVALATVLSSCGFTTTCPTYSKKPQVKETAKETRI